MLVLQIHRKKAVRYCRSIEIKKSVSVTNSKTITCLKTGEGKKKDRYGERQREKRERERKRRREAQGESVCNVLLHGASKRDFYSIFQNAV